MSDSDGAVSGSGGELASQRKAGHRVQGPFMAGKEIVCVSVMDWDWPFWTSRQHLMSQFSRQSRVLFVDPPPTFATDYLNSPRDPRLRRRLTSWLRAGGVSKRGERLLVWSPPPAIPFNRVKSRVLFQTLLSFNQQLFRRGLRRVLDRERFEDPILWISFNVYFGDAVVGQLGESLAVYHCTDEITGFPGYSPYVGEIEKRLASSCDLVLASSEVLADSKRRYNPNSHFVPNAADVDLFRRASAWDGPAPMDLLQLPAPRAGFVGQVEYRFDCDLLRYAAQALPYWSFALIGPVQEGNRDVEQLRALPNVHFLGLKQRDALPGYLAHLDVALIPYKINRLTEGIYPLKLHEYLAAGKAVVATPLPSLKGMDGLVYLAGDGPAFVQALGRALREDGPDRRTERWEAARSQSWEARAADISSLLEKTLRSKNASRYVGAGRCAIDGRSNLVVDETAAIRPEAALDCARDRSTGDSLQSGIASLDSGTAEIGPVPWGDRGSGLAPGQFLGLGRGLSVRHADPIKRLAYYLLGDLNLHRRTRAGHVLSALRSLEVRDAAVLDAGCGEGACSLALATSLPDCVVTGVDILASSVMSCRRMAHRLKQDNLHFAKADLTDLPYEDAFDAAVCVDVLEHVREDDRALESLYRALKPGGWLVMHVPLRHQTQRRFIPAFRSHRVAGHVRDEYLRDEILAKTAHAGFRIVDECYTFGAAGELAFELNSLFCDVPALGVLAPALTYPIGLILSYQELASRKRPRGNSILVTAAKLCERRHGLPAAGKPVGGRAV